MRTYLPALDPNRRAHAPDSVWECWQPVMGSHPAGHTPFAGKRYGSMEAQGGLCARYPRPGSGDCKGWYHRIRHLPIEDEISDEPLRDKVLQDCKPERLGVSRCTIRASGAVFADDGSITVTRYIYPYDMQYRATFATLHDYLTNAVTKRGFDTASVRNEIRSFETALRDQFRDPTERSAVLSHFCERPISRATELTPTALQWLQLHKPIAHNTHPEAESPRVLFTHSATR